MLIKGIIFSIIFALFVSRLIPKYLEFRETNIVNLLGINWEGNLAVMVLLVVVVLGIVVLAIAMQSFYQYFIANNNQSE
jgi:hypothetical protein